ncbi:MAG: hypothetical protein HC803_02130 [Saprospiraceae bacterium]|nr:hypothetical protein [Saprospiraceae bacterium]
MKLLQNILHLGTQDNQEETLRNQTIWLNKIAIFTFVIIGLYMLMHLFFGNSWVAIAFDFVYLFSAFLILFFHAQYQYTKAYYSIGIGYTLAFACSSMLIGSQNQIEYHIFISTLGTAMLFDDKWTKRVFLRLDLLYLPF